MKLVDKKKNTVLTKQTIKVSSADHNQCDSRFCDCCGALFLPEMFSGPSVQINSNKRMFLHRSIWIILYTLYLAFDDIQHNEKRAAKQTSALSEWFPFNDVHPLTLELEVTPTEVNSRSGCSACVMYVCSRADNTVLWPGWEMWAKD